MAEVRFQETTLSRTIADALAQSPVLQDWLLREVASRRSRPPGSHSVHAVHHRYTDSELDSRETDVLAVYRMDGPRSCWLLIEVKINAPFGPMQCEDYATRKQKAMSLGRCGDCVTMVVAPQAYLSAHRRDVELFDVSVSLEELRHAAAAGTGLADKLLVVHVGMALELFAAGYVPLHDALRESQVDWYHSFVRGYKPHLTPNVTNSARQTRDIFFPVPAQRRGYITHRIFAGEVSMGFMQRGHLLRDIERRLTLDEGDSDVLAELRGTSLYLRLRSGCVPALDEGQGFAEQEDALQQGIDAVDRLNGWAKSHRELLHAVVSNHVG